MRKRSIALLMAAVMLFGATFAGTLAWLQAQSKTVTNTFTAGDINITLTEEHEGPFHVLPGTAEAKDPKVTIEANSEKSWVFVQLKATDPDNLLTYSINETHWTPVPNTPNVWFRVEEATTAGATSYYVLAGTTTNPNGEVSYGPDLTKDVLEDSAGAELTFKAFAVQYEAASSAEEAWDLVPAIKKLA